MASDLISRDEAIAAVDSLVPMGQDGLLMKAMVFAALKSTVPAVDAAPVVHGQWDERRVDGIEDATIDAWQSAKCTNCGKYHTTPYLYFFNEYRYCPACGARMNGGEA